MKTLIIVSLLATAVWSFPGQNARARRGTQARYGGSRPRPPAPDCKEVYAGHGGPVVDESGGLVPVPSGDKAIVAGVDEEILPGGVGEPVLVDGGVVPDGGIKPGYEGGVHTIVEEGVLADGEDLGLKPEGAGYEGGGLKPEGHGGVVPEGGVKPGYGGGSYGYGGGGGIKPEGHGGVVPEGGVKPGYGGGSYGYGGGGGIKPEGQGGVVPEGGVKPGYGGGSVGYGGDGGIVPDGGVKPGYEEGFDGGVKPGDGGVIGDGGVKPGYGGGTFGYGGGGVKPGVDGGVIADGGVKPDYGGGEVKPDEVLKPVDGGGIIPGGVKPTYGGDGGLKPGSHSGIPIGPEGCICVPWYQCKDGEIITDGSGIIDPRKKYQPKNELPLEDEFKPPQCGKFHVCCADPSQVTEKPYEHYCGIRKPSGINRKILNAGHKGESEFGEWPWQGALMKLENKDIRLFQCGAVLIDKRHALTAAHCVNKFVVYEKLPLIVRFGEWDTQVTDEFLPHEDFKVDRVIIHPGFKNTSLWNDIAVLKFDRDVQFAPHIDTICLPKYEDIFVGQECVVTGWGKNAYKGGTYSNVLREVKVPIIDHHTCQDLLRKTRLGKYFRLHEAFTCAGGAADQDSCKGDGGGPIACYRQDGTYSLAGLVSWGIDCGQPNVPGVYVDVTKYLDWIKTVTSYALEEYWPRP